MATLALNPDQAGVIVKASALGSLSLVLRSIDDFAEVDTAQRSDANAAIRISSPFWAN
jgi:Flp pilus assembly protein CpaB